jgi:hypothetical protein
LYGKLLRVHRTHTRGDGKQFLCELPDGTIAGLPAWMMEAGCEECSYGEPLASLDALRSLRELLNALQTPRRCDKASLISLKEGVDGKRPDA